MLIAMGILAVGMVAIASMIPAAASLQRDTIKVVNARQVARNVEALFEMRPFPEATLVNDISGTNWKEDRKVHRIRAGELDKYWTLADRSYPSHVADDDRAVYWVPMVKDDNELLDAYQWVIYVFVLNKDRNRIYPDKSDGIWANPDDGVAIPGVKRVVVNNASGSVFTTDPSDPTDIEAGDRILDSNGIDYIVTGVNGNDVTVNFSIPLTPSAPDRLWYAPRAINGRASPTLKILVLGEAVE